MQPLTFLSRTPVRWAVGLAVLSGVIYLSFAYLRPFDCPTEVHQKIIGLSGFDFEISETDCDVLAKDAMTSVFVSKAGRTKKTLLFKYVPPGFDAIPTIASLDEHTVQISIRRVPTIFCRKEKWQTLTVKYDIGVVDYPARGGESDEC